MSQSNQFASQFKVVGRVVGLWRYPVKSMAGESLQEVDVSWHGVDGDRRWAFVRDDAVHNGFPWLTARDNAAISQFVPTYSNPARPESSKTVVATPRGETLDIEDPRLATQLHAKGVSLIRQSRGVFDTFPLSLITTQTLASLSQRVDLDLDVRRFRPNFLVEASSERSFPEDDWVGRTVKIGDVCVRIDKRDGRCVVTTLDPDTGEQTPQILTTIAAERDGCLGVYGTTVTEGRVAVGDIVAIESAG